MVTTVLLSSDALAATRAHAAEAYPLEACGLLLGTDELVEQALRCSNVAADPRTRFEIDPVALIAAHRRARSGGSAVLGCYHSHPSGPAEPSARDAADAAPDGGVWLILAGGRATAWRAVTGGSLHGRFDPLAIACEDGSATAQAAPCPGDANDH